MQNFSFEEYIQKVNDTYKDKNLSFSEILEQFSQLSKDYKNNETYTHSYSSFNYVECPDKEQEQFFADQLQFVECLVTNSIYDHQGFIWNWADIYKLIAFDTTYSTVEKTNRKVVYSTGGNVRPVGENAWASWNGLQIIDLDIKDFNLASTLKEILFDELKQYNWFLGICLSASKKSLHVWTKISPISIDMRTRKIEFLCNFRHKYSYVYMTLLKHAKDFEYTKDNIFEYMDMAMAKPQQGIFISSDTTAKLNTNFIDLRLDANFESAFISGVSSVNWISHPDLKDIFHKLEWFANDNINDNQIEVSKISGIQDRDLNKSRGKRHYKHNQRWQLANTLTALYGQDKAIEIMIDICQGTPVGELKGDIKTAAVHNKPISVWAVKELNNQHGFNIKLQTDNYVNEEIAKIDNKVSSIDISNDPTKVLYDEHDHIVMNIKNNQYLSDIKDDIIANLSHITLLEAGAGYGKTEMIKSLKAKTILILPFTSTIKAKVEADEKTSDWLYFYGNKRPTLDDLLSDNNMSMTIDKFSRLNLYELDQANFEYIVIDESHLLFTSSYRDVMAPTIQRLANCKAKVIMMTGTPTGELLFFPGIKHIKVYKEDNRTKDFEIHMVPTKLEKLVELCRNIATDILNGKKVLYPTNNGNLYFEQVLGLVQEYLDIGMRDKPLKAFYYKKSNYGDNSMDSINIDKTIGDNDIIFCTTYLSVGVDICDKYDFSVYFTETNIPQDIEQFANRLRNNDLHIKMFLEKEDSSGIPINYYYTQPLNLGFDKKDLLMARDLIRACNDMIERNEEDSKYSPIISHILSANKYLKYDENDCRYYIDETTYKLKVFEDRYGEYSKQLEVLMNGMKYYGYCVNIVNHDNRVDESRNEEIETYLRQVRNKKYNEDTIKTFKLLSQLDDKNIDMYKELIKGSYEIFKSDKFKVEREENNLYAEDIEILEKNIPIILSLYKYYDCPTIQEIYEYCLEIKQNRINFSKLERIRTFANIESSIKKKRLDFPVLKFIKDAQKWSKDNPVVSSYDIEQWLGAYATKIANNIKDVVVDDVPFLEEIFEITKQLWKVIIVQSRPKNGMINISPFELIWTKKTDIRDIYGGSLETRNFFIDELIDNMKPEEEPEEELKELELTDKKKLDNIVNELTTIVHKEFEYFKYSEEDNSNNRFLRKQENNSSLNDYAKNKEQEKETETVMKVQFDLFEDMMNPT